jgi:hypothetical protein
MRQMLGHDGPPTNFWRENLLTGEPLAECPLRTILRAHEERPALAREVDAHLRYYGAYDRGVLLVAGGISDQPARYIELMDRIDRQKNETEAKHLEMMRTNGEEDREPPSQGGY